MYESRHTTDSTHNTTPYSSSPTSRAVIPHENTNIGLLTQLPREVRDLVWEHLVPSYGQRTDLGILRTCRQLYEEVAPLVYQNEVLRFDISPAYQYQSWLSIVTHRGAELHLRDLQDATSRGFSSLPYTKLKGIRVEIEAPDSTDPGQMICLWKKVVSLVDLLLQVDGLPDLEIYFTDSKPPKWPEESKWSTDGIAQQSIPCDSNHKYYDEYDEDFEAILQPFYRLHNVQSASIHVVTTINGVGHLLKNAAAFMMLDKPFGCCRAEERWSDDSAQKSLDTSFLQFDNALDDLPGPTARMLRLERFSSWFEDGLHSKSNYVDELERAHHSDHYSSENMLFSIYNRCNMMLAFNPLSATMQEMRFQKHWWTGNRPNSFPLRDKWSAHAWKLYFRMSMTVDDDQFLEEENGGPYESQWDKEEWHRYYQDGIPCLNSESTKELYIQMGNPNHELYRCAIIKKMVDRA